MTWKGPRFKFNTQCFNFYFNKMVKKFFLTFWSLLFNSWSFSPSPAGCWSLSLSAPAPSGSAPRPAPLRPARRHRSPRCLPWSREKRVMAERREERGYPDISPKLSRTAGAGSTLLKRLLWSPPPPRHCACLTHSAPGSRKQHSGSG